MENPIKNGCLGVPLFSETPIYTYIKYYVYKYLENGSDLLKMEKRPKKFFPLDLLFFNWKHLALVFFYRGIQKGLEIATCL